MLYCTVGVEELLLHCGSKRGLHCILGVEGMLYHNMEVGSHGTVGVEEGYHCTVGVEAVVSYHGNQGGLYNILWERVRGICAELVKRMNKQDLLMLLLACKRRLHHSS